MTNTENENKRKKRNEKISSFLKTIFFHDFFLKYESSGNKKCLRFLGSTAYGSLLIRMPEALSRLQPANISAT